MGRFISPPVDWWLSYMFSCYIMGRVVFFTVIPCSKKQFLHPEIFCVFCNIVLYNIFELDSYIRINVYRYIHLSTYVYVFYIYTRCTVYCVYICSVCWGCYKIVIGGLERHSTQNKYTQRIMCTNWVGNSMVVKM